VDVTSGAGAAGSTGLPDRLAVVWERIGAAGGSPATVTLVAVTKGHGVDVVTQAQAAGLVDLGENYAQDLVAKAEALGERGADAGEVRWHFIGHVQRNKVRAVAPLVHLWHGVDRASVGTEIARRAPGAAVLVQVNVSGEASKAGCAPAELPALLDALRGHELDVRGLMTVAPARDREASERAFAELRGLRDDHDLTELSMGMSDDFDLAVANGATMVRVGSALFGPRPGPAGVGN
jgi:pyridoxal phosphate enzyme (YggS family)